MLTLRGAAIIGTSLALFTVGLLTINGVLMTIAGAGLLFIAGCWFVGRRNLARLETTLHLPPRVFANTLFDLRILLLNRRRLLDSFQVSPQLQLAKAANIHTHSLWVGASSSTEAKLRGSIPGRGHHREHLCLLRSEFPFGLLQQERRTMVSQDILVFPKAITPREFFSSGDFDDSWMGSGLQSGETPGEPRGVRPFRPGDPAKRMHWPSTIRSLARGRSPRVRESDPPGLRPQRATVLFHSYGTDGALIRTDHFERSLSLLCGTLRHLRILGVPASLCADFQNWQSVPAFHPKAWSQALTALAQAERSEKTEAHDLEAAIHGVPLEEALIIISDMPPETWNQSLPKRSILVVDIRQHNYSHKTLNLQKATRSIPA